MFTRALGIRLLQPTVYDDAVGRVEEKFVQLECHVYVNFGQSIFFGHPRALCVRRGPRPEVGCRHPAWAGRVKSSLTRREPPTINSSSRGQSGLKYVAEISYDGTGYYGFQLQPSPALTIQFVVERALTKFLGVDRHFLLLQGAARTDSGVHAKQQYIQFFSPRPLEESTFLSAINRLLPSDVAAHSLQSVAPDFNVRYSRGKIYTYDVHLGPKCAFRSRYRQEHSKRQPLDREAMNAACGALVGEHDYRFLSAYEERKSSANASTKRTVYSVEVADIDDGVRFTVHGKGFLHKMVRNMVGVLLAVGEGSLTLEDVDVLLSADERLVDARVLKSRFKVAPGKGLTLRRVDLYY
jgi:tRNA pseudouridine38-40 synthase